VIDFQDGEILVGSQWLRATELPSAPMGARMNPIGPNSSSTPNPDHCGSCGVDGFVPDGGFGVDWSDACRSHDEGYATPGADKDLCDYSLQHMSLACAAQDGVLCHITAGIYYQALNRLGDEAFEHAQESAPK
jgi:hypothetical protein